MSLEKNGFLSPNLEKWVVKNRTKNKTFFDQAEKLNEFCMELLLTGEVQPDEKSFVGALILSRAIQSFQGTLLLVERGMVADARTLVRSSAECAIALGCLVLDDSFLQTLIGGHQRSMALTAKSILLNGTLNPEKDADKIKQLEELIRNFQATTPQKLNWKNLAKTAEFVELYEWIYADTSNDGSHVSINSLSRHTITDGDDTVTGIKFGPELDGVDSTVVGAIGALSHCLMAYGRLIGNQKTEQVAIENLESLATVVS